MITVNKADQAEEKSIKSDFGRHNHGILLPGINIVNWGLITECQIFVRGLVLAS